MIVVRLKQRDTLKNRYSLLQQFAILSVDFAAIAEVHDCTIKFELKKTLKAVGVVMIEL